MAQLCIQLGILQINYYSSLLAYLPALVNAVIIFYIHFKLPRNKTSYMFTWVVAALMLWQLEDTILRLPISMETARIWDGILCIGWFSIAPLLFHFSCRFAQLKKFYSLTSLLFVYLPFVFLYIQYMTDLKEFEFVHDKTWGWINQLRGDTFEQIRWFAIYTLTVASVAILVRHALLEKTNIDKKKQARIIAFGILLSASQIIVMDLLFPIIFSTPQIPVNSTCMILFSITTIIAISRYKLFRISDSVKSYPLLEHLNKLVMIVSPEKKLIYINPHASFVLGISRINIESVPFEKLFSPEEDDYDRYMKEVFVKVIGGQPVDNFPCSFISHNGERINVMMSSSAVVNNNIQQGILIIANDITPMVKALRDLEIERLVKQKEIAEACLTTQEEERKFIGGELHDNVNQILASSMLYLSMMKNNNDIRLATDVENLIMCAIQEIRKLSHVMIAPSLDEAELTKALDNIVEMTRKSGQLDIQKEAININEASLSEKMKLNIYRIIQEQLNNIIKYSRASSVRLHLMQENNKLSLKIVDNGVGFDTTSRSLGRGIANMKSRAQSNNGQLNIISSPGNGCELSVVFET